MGNKFNNRTQVNLRPKVCKSPYDWPEPPVDRVTTCIFWNPAPRRISIPVAGITNGSCTNCIVFNRDWIITYVSGCQWNLPTPLLWHPCTLTSAQFQLTLQTTTTTLSITGNGFLVMTYRMNGHPVNATASFALARINQLTGCLGFPDSLTLNPLNA
jgi:hypothetical protein